MHTSSTTVYTGDFLALPSLLGFGEEWTACTTQNIVQYTSAVWRLEKFYGLSTRLLAEVRVVAFV